MAGFSIGEVEEITGIKAHTLRYWEEVIPAFSPSKDIGGRRVYTKTDIQIIFRLNYLITEKKFTIEGARNQIISEAAVSNVAETILPEVYSIRSDLLDLYSILHSKRKGKTS